MKTISKKLETAFKREKKQYVAELLGVSRPTLDAKIRNNNFTKEEIKILIQNHIITKI